MICPDCEGVGTYSQSLEVDRIDGLARCLRCGGNGSVDEDPPVPDPVPDAFVCSVCETQSTGVYSTGAEAWVLPPWWYSQDDGEAVALFCSTRCRDSVPLSPSGFAAW